MSLTLVLLLFLLCYLLFVWKSGFTFPILYLFLFTYFIQYVFSVFLIYNEYPELRKQMPIKENDLFSYVTPALAFLFAGVFLFNKDVPVRSLLTKIDPRDAARLGHLLIALSFGIDFILNFEIPGIQSIYSFTFFLKFSGAMCYLFSPSIFHYLLLLFVYGTLAFRAIVGGVFIDFFMWATYLFTMATLSFRFHLVWRLSFILIAAPVLILIQSVKVDYRKATWFGKREAGVGYLTELAQEKQREERDPFARSAGVVNTVGRLNQGWHLGKVLKWVPKHEPFANGQDLLGDIQGTILPRFFFPEKKTIGSQDKFYRYTGHKLRDSTSMTIGVLGDFYINFGRNGSFIALFLFGAFMARAVYWFMKNVVMKDPINIVWVPFLFSYLVRANNDFYMVFNSLVKGFLIFLFIQYLRKQLWPAKPMNSNQAN